MQPRTLSEISAWLKHQKIWFCITCILEFLDIAVSFCRIAATSFWVAIMSMGNALTTESIERAALRLQPDARARLAHSLVGSLGELSPEQLEMLWLDEAERRDQEMAPGMVKGVPGEEVFSRIEEKYNK